MSIRRETSRNEITSKTLHMVQTFYRDIPCYESWPACVKSPEDISADQQEASLYREKKSHLGISNRSNLKKLIAKQVNQDFLDEISALDRLEYLELQIVSAEDLSVIRSLTNLKTLKIYSPRRANNFSPLVELKSLTKLFIQNARYLTELDVFMDADNLISLGVEGGMYTPQRVRSLNPLAGLSNLEAIFLTNVRLEDKDLSCLSRIPNLKILECARFAPKASFAKLRELMPTLNCRWCDEYEIDIARS